MRILFAFFLLFLIQGYNSPTLAQTAAATYYVDCISGNNSSSGTSPSSPWKSLIKVAGLKPGDTVQLKRGCNWSETLTLGQSGSSAQPIRITAYGDTTQPLPIISNTSGSGAGVRVTGSNLIIDSLDVRGSSPNKEVGCENNPKGGASGFSLESGSTNVIIRNNTVSGFYAGVFIRSGSHHNRIEENILENNTMMNPLDQSADNDAGAFGVLLWGDDNDIAFNTIRGHNACSYDYQRDGAAVEVYGGQRNVIHHNTGFQNDAFTELGNNRSRDNTYAYNLFYSDLPNSIFIVTRGAGNHYGPIVGTKAYHNTIVLRGAKGRGFVCYAGCNSTIFSLRNNIIDSTYKVGEADQVFDEDYNVFWGGGRSFTIGSHSIVTNPLFIDPQNKNFHLQLNSPALLAGLSSPATAQWNYDLDRQTFALSGTGKLHAGAYSISYGNTPSPTVIPRPSFSPSSIPSSSPRPSPSSVSVCDADLNRDGLVDIADYGLLVSNFLKTGTALRGDLNRDGLVDLVDYSFLIRSFFQTCPLPSISPTLTPRPTPTLTPTVRPSATPITTPTPSPTSIPGDAVVMAVGDFNGSSGPDTEAVAVADIMRSQNPQIILGLGDYQYTYGDPVTFASGFRGAMKKNGTDIYPLFRPISGPSHDVRSGTDIADYTVNWGRNPFAPYSFNIGSWHIIALPSPVYRYKMTTNQADILNWLENDLTTNSSLCTLAYWHEPFFTSASSGHSASEGDYTKPWVDKLYAHNADVLLAGHQHGYERFAPQNPASQADPARGLRQFVVGTGGIGFYSWSGQAPNVEIQNANTYGALKLILRANGYEAQFLRATGGTFTDSTSGTCH